MNVLQKLAPITLLLTLFVAAPVSAQYNSSSEPDIVETAAQVGTFETLLAALDAAGLTEALKGDGPFTVFAPTDEAFDALPEGTVEALLQDPDALAQILTYHVLAGTYMASDVAGMEHAETLQGGHLSISASDYGVRINDASVITADVEASNGVIHVIDAVLIPAN